MASLLSRIFPGTVRADINQHSPSKQTSQLSESIRKSTKRRSSSHVKARKSITSLFGFATKVTPSGDGVATAPRSLTTSNCNTSPTVTAHTVGTCLEAKHYPIYDPTNPDHEPSFVVDDKVKRSSSIKRSLSRSPKKLPLRKESLSPKRSPSAGKRKSRLQGLADTLRAKANMFYGSQEESSEEETRLQEAPVPPTPSSAKTVSSRKSVRFRSDHSVIDRMHSNSSPITIPIKSPPSLSLVNISDTPMFDTVLGEEANLGQTARPPETLSLHIPSRPSPERYNPQQLSLEIDDKAVTVQALPTPMPGTNLPLEDPFNDAAVTLHPDYNASKMLSGQISSDQGYVSDEESNAETTKNSTSGITRITKSSAQGLCGSSPDQKDLPKSISPLAPENSDESSTTRPASAQRTSQHIKYLRHTFNEPSSIPRLPSETQYDADAEPSDGSEVLGDQVARPVVKSHHQLKYHDRESTQDSEIGAGLFRCEAPHHMRPSPHHAVPRLVLKKPTSDESEEVPLSLSAGNEAILQFADRAGKDSMGMETTPTSDILKTNSRQERLTPSNLRPTLQSRKPSLEEFENVNPASIEEPIKQEKAISPVNNADRSGQIGSTLSANSISPLHLPSTVSLTSPPHAPCLLRIHHPTDENAATKRLEDYSLGVDKVREEVGPGPGEAYSRRATTPPFARSPADIPLPRSSEAGRKCMTPSFEVTGRVEDSLWSPFEEPRFVAIAYTVLQKSPETLRQRLRSEGISRDLWKQLGLPDETAPVHGCKPYNEMELLDLFAAITDRARAPLSFPHSTSHVGTPMDYADDQIPDLDALNAFTDQVSPLSVRAQSQGRHATRNGAGLVGSASSSPLPVFSSRRSSQGRLATPLRSRQVSSHSLCMDRHPTPDVTPLSQLDPTVVKAAVESESPHRSASEVRSHTGNHSNSLQSRSVFAKPGYSDADVQTTAQPNLVIRSRQESSDESQETQRSVTSSASSSPPINQSFTADAKPDSSIKRKHRAVA